MNLQEAVKTIFVRKVKKLSGNRIPKIVRKLQRRRKQLSVKLRKTRCWKKLISLQEDIGLIEDKLKRRYEKDRDKKEKKAVGKIVSDPNYFYNYAKKILESQNKLVH